MNEITMIGLSHLHPHPDNPRKDLGDLSEMTESIRKNGIMQNLTVIPVKGHEGEYRVVIGHRRRAAALEAGLTEVPCRIVPDMDKKTQISIMLEENMQRNDLTIVEQAQGFQMMLDLGIKPEEIAERTGFSKATVYHRLNIAKLNASVLKEKQENPDFQLSIGDLYALEQVESIETRDRLLKEATSSANLKWKAAEAAAEEREQKNMDMLVPALELRGIKKMPAKIANRRWDYETKHIFNVDIGGTVDPDVVADDLKELEDPKNTYWTRSPYSRRLEVVYVKPEKEKKETEEDKKRKQQEADKKELDELFEAFQEKIRKFCLYMLEKKLGKDKELRNVDAVLKICIITNTSRAVAGSRDLAAYMIGEVKSWNVNKEMIDREMNRLSDVPAYTILLLSYAEECNNLSITEWSGAYKQEVGKYYKTLTGWLKPFGFELTQEEKEIIEGKHRLYRKEQ